MKKLKILVVLLVSTILASCVTTKMTSNNLEEKIYSIVYDPQENKQGFVYAIGEHYDYQVEPCKYSIQTVAPTSLSRSQNAIYSSCLQGLEFILRHKKDIKEVVWNFNQGIDTSNQFISGTYQAIFPRNKLQDIINQNKGEMIKELTLDEQKKFQRSNVDYVKISIPFAGKVVKLTNRNEILAKGQFKKPLLVNVPVTEWKKRLSIMPVLKGTAAIALAPVAVVLLVPYVAVIGHCESTVC